MGFLVWVSDAVLLAEHEKAGLKRTLRSARQGLLLFGSLGLTTVTTSVCERNHARHVREVSA